MRSVISATAGSDVHDTSRSHAGKQDQQHRQQQQQQHRQQQQQQQLGVDKPRCSVQSWPPMPQPGSSSSFNRGTNSQYLPGGSLGNIRLQPAQLTAAIMQAATPHQLLQLIQQHGGVLNHIHVSALYTRTKALCGGVNDSGLQQPAVQQLLQQLQLLAEQFQDQFEARGLANIILSCGFLQQPTVVSLLLPHLLQQNKLQQANPQEISNTLHGVAEAKVQLRVDLQLEPLLNRFVQLLPAAKPQDVSGTLQAVASMGQQQSARQLQPLLNRFMQLLHAAQHGPHNSGSNTAAECDIVKTAGFPEAQLFQLPSSLQPGSKWPPGAEAGAAVSCRGLAASAVTAPGLCQLQQRPCSALLSDVSQVADTRPFHHQAGIMRAVTMLTTGSDVHDTGYRSHASRTSSTGSSSSSSSAQSTRVLTNPMCIAGTSHHNFAVTSEAATQVGALTAAIMTARCTAQITTVIKGKDTISV